jgi:hypothetical protein
MSSESRVVISSAIRIEERIIIILFMVSLLLKVAVAATNGGDRVKQSCGQPCSRVQ